MKYNTFKVENKEDSGEDIASLSFTPDNEFCGKRRNICKSIKLKVDISLNDLYQLLDQIFNSEYKI